MRVFSHLPVAYSRLWAARFYCNFPHFFMKVRIKKRIFGYKMCVLFSVHPFFCNISHVKKNPKRYIIINIIRYAYKALLTFVRFA